MYLLFTMSSADFEMKYHGYFLQIALLIQTVTDLKRNYGEGEKKRRDFCQLTPPNLTLGSASEHGV